MQLGKIIIGHQRWPRLIRDTLDSEKETQEEVSKKKEELKRCQPAFHLALREETASGRADQECKLERKKNKSF